MINMNSFLPSTKIIEKIFKGHVDEWYHFGQFHLACIKGINLYLRKFDFVIIGIETNEGTVIQRNEFSENILEYFDNNIFRKNICLALFVTDESEWYNIKTTQPLLKLTIKLQKNMFYSNVINLISLNKIITENTDPKLLNPYNYSGVCSKNMFFFRKDEVNQIIDECQRSFLVSSQEKMGKSSFLKHVKNEIKRTYPKQSVTIIDCISIISFNDFVIKILEETAPKSAFQYFNGRCQSSIDRILHVESSRQKTAFVIMLDNFDYIFNMNEYGLKNIIKTITSNKLKGYCRFIISCSETCEEIFRESMPQIRNFFSHIKLCSFSIKEATSFIKSTFEELNIPLAHDDNSISYILNVTEMKPWLLQKVCFHITHNYFAFKNYEHIDIIIKTLKKYDIVKGYDMKHDNKINRFIFICYAHKDYEFAVKLYNDLKKYGETPWLDKESLLPGEQWKEGINNAIKKSDYFVVLISSNSTNHKGYMNNEIRIGFEQLDSLPDNEIYIIPVRIENASPSLERINDLHRVDLFLNWDKGVSKIIKTIQRKRNDESLYNNKQ